MPDLNALMIFAKVVEAGSFSEAARRTDRPVSTVSRKVAELEAQLGVRLLERSTRQLRLTDLGAEILQHALRSVEISETVNSLVSDQLAELKGTLRVSAPPSIADTVLAPLLTGFQSQHPGMHVHALITDRHVDHIAEGIDLAFRVGPLEDSNLVARRVLRYRHRLVASPQYLTRATAPVRPADLLEHRLLSFSFWSMQNVWAFTRGDARETVKFHPHIAMNDYLGLATALRSGAGIGELPPIVCPEMVENGTLVEVMSDWHFAAVDVSAVHLGNRHIPRAVRLFKDYAVQTASTLFDDLPV